MRSETTIAKWGNSLAVRIPRTIAAEARVSEGDHLVLVVAEDGSIVLRSSRRRYNLEQLVSRITPKNRHTEAEWGGPEGKEHW